jgi:hypothetical protein
MLYPDWSVHIKSIYDGLPGLRVVFTEDVSSGLLLRQKYMPKPSFPAGFAKGNSGGNNDLGGMPDQRLPRSRSVVRHGVSC